VVGELPHSPATVATLMRWVKLLKSAHIEKTIKGNINIAGLIQKLYHELDIRKTLLVVFLQVTYYG